MKCLSHNKSGIWMKGNQTVMLICDFYYLTNKIEVNALCFSFLLILMAGT